MRLCPKLESVEQKTTPKTMYLCLHISMIHEKKNVETKSFEKDKNPRKHFKNCCIDQVNTSSNEKIKNKKKEAIMCYFNSYQVHL